MKKILCFAIIIGLVVVLSGCTPIPPSEQTESSSASSIEELVSQADNETTEIIYSSKNEISQELSLYKNMEFSNETLHGQLELYTSAEKNSEGAMLWDDSNTFFIQVVLNEENYIIFDKQFVQLGCPKAGVFFDDENVLHIVLTDVRTAQYHVYDFIYDSQNQYFIKNVVMETSPINYWGEI